MNQDNKAPGGAPSDDTTSALFVSARKKQLEQQEQERRAKEKEDERLAAEAEVRRLEAEVEERRRKAEEDARRAEAEAEQRKRQADEEARRIAEEARAKKEKAAEDPDSVLGAQPQKKEIKLPKITLPQMPKSFDKDPGISAEPIIKQPINKKMLFIGGGAVAAIALIVILVFALGGGNDGYSGGTIDVPSRSPSPPVTNASPIDITAEYFYMNGNEDGDSVWFFSDGTMEIYYSSSGTTDTHDYVIAENTISVHGNLYGRPAPFTFTIMSEDLLIDQDGDQFVSMGSSYGEGYGGSGGREFHELNSSIYFMHPADWSVAQTNQATTAYAPVFVAQHEWSDDFMLIYNYTPEFHDFMSAGRSGMDNLIEDFAVHFLGDRGYDIGDIYNVAFGDAFFTTYGNEVIAMRCENNEAYFAFLVVKIFTEPQQLIAVAVETRSESALNELLVIIDSIDLR